MGSPTVSPGPCAQLLRRLWMGCLLAWFFFSNKKISVCFLILYYQAVVPSEYLIWKFTFLNKTECIFAHHLFLESILCFFLFLHFVKFFLRNIERMFKFIVMLKFVKHTPCELKNSRSAKSNRGRSPCFGTWRMTAEPRVWCLSNSELPSRQFMLSRLKMQKAVELFYF